MELNREQIVTALTMFIEDMPAELHLGFTRTVMFRGLLQDTLALINELTEEKQELAKKHGDLKKQFHYLDMECCRLEKRNDELTEEVAKAKADTLRDIQIKFAMHFGTYTGDAEVKVSEVFKLLSKFAEEMLEGEI